MENLIFLFHFLRLTLLHYIYPNPRLSFHFFILFWLLCAFYYCKSLLPTIGRLDPRVPPDSVLLHSTVKLAPLFYPDETLASSTPEKSKKKKKAKKTQFVLGCIDADSCDQIRVGKLFTRSINPTFSSLY